MLRRKNFLNTPHKSVLLILFIMCFTSISLAQVWTTKTPVLTSRNLMSIGVVKGIIYTIGGSFGAYSSTSTVEAYDTTTDSWTLKAPLPEELCGACACVVNNKIYVFGGSVYVYGEAIASVYEFTPDSNIWVKKSDLPTPMSWSVAQAVNGKIYIIGGAPTGFNSGYQSVYEYDPVLDSWDTNKTPMPTARFGHTAEVVDGKIYVMGGAIDNSLIGITSVAAYDPATNTWTPKDSLSVPVCLHTSSVVNGKIYIFSGGNGFSILYNNVEEYDPVLDKWTEKTPIPTPRWGASTCTLDDKIYVIGGADINNQRLATVEVYNPALDPITSVEVDVRLLDNFKLEQNYPNPFNPTTTIKYSIPKLSFVTIKIYDVLGREVVTLVDEYRNAGNYEVKFDARNLPSGVYIYKLRAGSFIQTKKMILLR